MYRALRSFWNLAAVGGTIAVGLLTRDAGFTALTLFGGFIAPRALGLAGPGPFARFGRGGFLGARGWGGPGRRGGWGGPCGRGGRSWGDQAWEDWHRQAHQSQPTAAVPAPPVSAA
jgi:hypothetical protein